MRLGILQCDSVPAEIRDISGDYPDMFQRFFSSIEPAITYRVYDLANDVFPVSVQECDAWLFTGSSCGANDEFAWIRRAEQLVLQLHAQRLPTIGVCFGHQLIARALGGEVARAAAGWGVGARTMSIHQQRPWMQSPKRDLTLLVSHRDQVTRLPDNAVLLASSPFCANEMSEIDGHMLTVQGHPEFTVAFEQALMDRRRDTLGDKLYAAAAESLQQPTDGATVGAWMLAFIRQQSNRQQPAMHSTSA